MSVVLVNGDGNPAVHASQDADLLGGIGGQETGILDINDKFAATIADANTVEISSGVCITKEGRRIQIDVGDVEEIVVPTGSQGTTKYYIIGFHLYTDGIGNQLAETFIDEVASPSATITEKMFKDGETEVYVSLYRITRNGLNLEGLTLILPEIGSLAGGGIIGNTDISGIADGTVTGAIAQINTDLSIKYNPTDDYLYILVNGTWVKWRKANMDKFYIFSPNGFAEGYALGNYQTLGSGWPKDYKGITQTIDVNDEAIIGNFPHAPSTSTYSLSCYRQINPTINVTTYSSLKMSIVYDGATIELSADVSNLTGDYYVSFGHYNNANGIGNFDVYVKTSAGTYAPDNSVASDSYSVGNPATNKGFSITKIWLE